MSETVKPSKNEDEYFAKIDVDKARRLARLVSSKYQKEEKEKMQHIHHMHCAKCGMDLQEITFQGFVIDKCFDCGAVILDADQFAKLAGSEAGFLDALVSLFK